MKDNLHETNTNLVSLQRSLLLVLTSQMAVTHVQKQSPGSVLEKESLCENLFFNKVAGFRPATLVKKTLA